MSAATAPAETSPTAVFKNRDFVLMWLAQLVSTAGSALTDLAAGIYVYNQTGSAFLVGVTLMATAVPSLIVGLIAGVYVDRWDRRKTMVVSNLAQAAVVATIPFLLGINITLLFVAILVNAGVKMFFDPAYEALIPEIASDEELTAANSFLQIASFGSTAIGFAGAGLLAAIDIRLAFWIDSLTFIFSAGCIWLMRVRVKMQVSDEPASVSLVVANLKVGVRTITGSPMLRSLFLLGAPAFFSFGLWNVLLLPMAIKVLGGTEFEYGIQEGLTSVGFVLGSLFMAKYASRLPMGMWMFVAMMGMGAAGILYGMATSITVGIIWVMVSGFFNSPSAVARQTLLQRNTPRELRGRVFSAMFVMRDIIFLAGMACAGLADIIDVRVLIIFSSLILVAVGLACLVAPGVGRPAAEWRRGLVALRASHAAGAVGTVRPATMADFDLLVGRLATLTRLSQHQRDAFLRDALVRDVPEGARVVTTGEHATAAYFILEGRTAAGVPEADGGYRGLSTMGAGEFFGEIAALTGSPRTADVVAVGPTSLLEVPAAALRGIMEVPEVNKLLLNTLTERLTRSSQPDLPRLVSMDQAVLRELRTAAPPTVESVPSTS
jgi:MFS family permease